MMRRKDKTKEAEEPLLFDLPLSSTGREDEEEPLLDAPRRPARTQRVPAPEPAAPEPPRKARPVAVPAPEPVAGDEADEGEDAGSRSEFPGRGRRFASGGADLLVHAAIAVVALMGVRALGVRSSLTVWPAYGLFLLSFSFLFTVLPLAFWGHTLGMAWAGITAHNRDGEPLTFDQTVRRWLGGILTTALLGLPLLVTGDRRSLTDVLSGSASYPVDEDPA